MASKHYYAWAVVGDGNPEPVAVQCTNGIRQVFTIGCVDPYNIDDEGCPCKLLPNWEQDVKDNRYIAKVKLTDEHDHIEVPRNILSRRVRQELERKFASELGPRHGYAGFGRRSDA